MPIGFASSTYFPIPEIPFLSTAVQFNPLHQLAEGLRALLLMGKVTGHLVSAAGLCGLLLVALIPLDMRLLRKRVFGDR
jgi:ABC-type polysaccharide/polyol phosphate export permease